MTSTSRAGMHSGRHRNPRGQGERLREEILDAADALLAESGDASKLSLRGVAKVVGIAATSVYLHFPDIDDLKVAVVERGFAELDAARDAASHGIADPAAALLARLRAYARFALDFPGRYRLMFGPELPPTLAYGAERSPGQRVFQSLVRSIERCQEARESRTGDDPVRMAIVLWAAVHGFVILRLDRPNFPWPPLDEMVNETVRRLVGIGTASPPASGANGANGANGGALQTNDGD
jgi:AcrR family transcriptional regulator